MKNKFFLFSALAATAVVVAPVVVEEVSASTLKMEKGKYFNFNLQDEQWIIEVFDSNNNELKQIDRTKKIFEISASNLNKFYTYDLYVPQGRDHGKFHLTGTVNEPIAQFAYALSDSTMGETLRNDSSIKIVKHSFKKSTPHIKDGLVYLGFEKLGDTIEFSNGMVATVRKTDEYSYYELKVTKGGVKPVAIVLNGNTLNVSASESPYITNGTTMVPLRVISEALGATVKYHQSKSISLIVESKEITLNNNSKIAYVKNSGQLTMSAPVTIKNGRTYVPLRFISESLGAKVNFDKLNYKVTITK